MKDLVRAEARSDDALIGRRPGCARQIAQTLAESAKAPGSTRRGRSQRWTGRWIPIVPGYGLRTDDRDVHRLIRHRQRDVGLRICLWIPPASERWHRRHRQNRVGRWPPQSTMPASADSTESDPPGPLSGSVRHTRILAAGRELRICPCPSICTYAADVAGDRLAVKVSSPHRALGQLLVGDDSVTQLLGPDAPGRQVDGGVRGTSECHEQREVGDHVVLEVIEELGHVRLTSCRTGGGLLVGTWSSW